MVRSFFGLFFGVSTLFLSINLAHADFIKTRTSGLYFAPGGRVAVALSHKEGAEGVFVVAGNLPPAQEFDLERLPRDELNHVFVRFQDGRYTEVVIGEHVYKLTGNATLNLAGIATVGIDNNNPFLSVVSEGTQQSGASIVGFIGSTQEAINGGRAAAAILPANQSDPEVASIIKPYQVQLSGLFIGDKAVTSRTVGVLVEPPSKKVSCLKPDTIYLDSDQLKTVQGAKTENDRVKLLDQYVKENKKKSPADGLLFIRVMDESVIALKITDQSVKQIKELKKAGTGSAAHRLCVVNDVPLG